MKSARLLITLFLIIFSSLANADPQLEMLRKRVISELLQGPVNDARVKELITTIKPDGTWPGIDYADISRTGFQHGEHLTNLVTLARAYRKEGSRYRGSKQVKKVIDMALNHWLDKDYLCDNWWWNQIGTPTEFLKIMLLMDNDLSGEQTIRALPIAGRANMNASGARPSGDRIKIAGLLAKNALFQRNDSLFNAVIKIIEGEIKYTTGPGLQYDLSFQHRPDRVMSTLAYGTGYADNFAEWAAFVAGTKYEFSEKSLNLLTDYYIDGICQTMVYAKYPDAGGKNRDITRVNGLEQYGTTTPERLMRASSYRKDELQDIINLRKGQKAQPVQKTRFFFDSEYFSSQQPGYFSSVRMFSSRNHNMEVAYNGEGLMNHHYADGSNFISRTGTEYFNISPVFDWQKIPGTTIAARPSLPSENEIQKPGLTDFVGAVTDGKLGAAAFDFKGLLDPVEARKAWFFFGKFHVCLGSGISCVADLPVATTVNQCLLRGEVITGGENGRSVAGKGEQELKNVRWILHDSIGYIFPEPAALKLSNQAQKGSWFGINRQSDSPKEVISLDVFKLWFDHGNKPKNENYQYIVLPAAAEKDVEAMAAGKDIEILANTTGLQAVRCKSLNITEAIFYTSGELSLADGTKVGMDSPGMIMIYTEGKRITKISVSDPSRKLKRIHLTVSSTIGKSGPHFIAVWNPQANATMISVDLAQGTYAGQSTTIEL